MADYFVKDDGTGLGDAGRYTTPQTGSFAGLGVANYYDSLASAFAATTVPVTGDRVFVSDIHNFLNAIATSLAITSGINTEIQIICVSDTAIDVESAGALESWNDGLDLDLSGNFTMRGIDLSIGDDWTFAAGSRVVYQNGNVTLSGAGDSIVINGVSVWLRMENSTITSVAVNGNTGVNLNNGSFEMIGGSVINGGVGLINFIRGGANGNLTANLVGVDMSSVTGTIFANFGAGLTDDVLMFKACGCNKDAATDWTNEEFGYIGQEFNTFNSGDVSAEGEYQFYYESNKGVAEYQTTTGIIRDESTAFPSGEKVSISVVTTATSTRTRPIVIDLLSTDADLSNVASDVITIYFASTTALTDNDVWAELYYPDGINQNIYNRVSNQNADILGAGTAHTDDSGSSTWLDNGIPLVGYNEYRMDLDTSVNPGANSVPVIKIFCALASTTIIIDTSVGVS